MNVKYLVKVSKVNTNKKKKDVITHPFKGHFCTDKIYKKLDENIIGKKDFFPQN